MSLKSAWTVAKSLLCTNSQVQSAGCKYQQRKFGLVAALFWVSISGCRSIGPDQGGSQLRVQPSMVDFRTVAVGSVGWQTVTISNSGATPLKITQALVKGTSFTTPNLVLPITIAAGQSNSFGVRFAPTTASEMAGSLSLLGNGLRSSGTIALSGAGV